MKKVIKGLLVLLLFTCVTLSSAEEIKIRTIVLKPVAFIPKTGQTTSYVSGDDGSYQMGNPTNPRFTDNGDDTVTDNATGLIWEQKTNSSASIHYYRKTYNWKDAFDVFLNGSGGLNTIKFAGHYDWRIPNISELRSIVDYGAFQPAIYPIFNTSPYYTYGGTGAINDGECWSSTRDAQYGSYCWFIDFWDGTAVDISNGDTRPYLVRAVCGGKS